MSWGKLTSAQFVTVYAVRQTGLTHADPQECAGVNVVSPCYFRSYGAALLVLSEEDYDFFALYLDFVRPQIHTENSEALLTQSGQKLHHYKDLVKSLTTRLKIEDFPNCTEVRKEGATTVSACHPKTTWLSSHSI